jgi:hypothetical protein
MASLTLSILAHALLGVAVAAVTWLVGLGYLVGGMRGRLAAPDAVHAYPIGLLAVSAASLLFLVEPWLGAAAAVALAVPFALLVRDGAVGGRVLRQAVHPLAWALPAVLGLPIALGLLLHGPTAELDSRAFGDMLYYVNKLVSASQTVFPFHDLLAEGQRIIYVEAASSFVGATFAGVPGLDPILFQTSTLPAFVLVSLCIGLGLLGERRRSAPSVWIAALGLLAASALIYPTWMVETPPVAMAVPLAFSVYRLWAAPPMMGWLVALAAALALGVLLTKVVAGIPLAVVVASVLIGRLRGRLDLRSAALAVGGSLTAAALAVVVLVATASWYTGLFDAGFLPADAARGLADQLTNRDTRALSPALEIAGQLALFIALLRTRSFAFAVAMAISIAGVWFVTGQSFDMALGTAILLAALHFWTRPATGLQERRLVLGAAVLLALSAWLREVSGIRAGFVFVTLLAVALVVAFGVATDGRARVRAPLAYGVAAVGLMLALAGAPVLALVAVAGLVVLSTSSLPRRMTPALVPAAIALGLVGSASVAAAAARDDDLRLARIPSTLTSEDYELWRAVERVVPRDGLVFTSMTGRQVDARHGWNNYPSIAGRQLYLAGWYDGRLVSDRDELDRRLALNEEVLSGATAPTELDFGRDFSSYFAALYRRERVPPSWERMYANRLFALYRIPLS